MVMPQPPSSVDVAKRVKRKTAMVSYNILALWWRRNSIGPSTKLWCTSVNTLYTSHVSACMQCTLPNSVVLFVAYGQTPAVCDISALWFCNLFISLMLRFVFEGLPVVLGGLFKRRVEPFDWEVWKRCKRSQDNEIGRFHLHEKTGFPNAKPNWRATPTEIFQKI